MIIPFEGKHPKLGNNVFVAPTAVIIGDVTVGDGCGIWYGTVLRADLAPIVIGRDTFLLDQAIVHGDPMVSVLIGSRVIIDKRAVVQGCTIEDECHVGPGAVLENGVILRKASRVAPAAVVEEGSEIDSGKMAAGVPAIVIRSLTEKDFAMHQLAINSYRELCLRMVLPSMSL